MLDGLTTAYQLISFGCLLLVLLPGAAISLYAFSRTISAIRHLVRAEVEEMLFPKE